MKLIICFPIIIFFSLTLLAQKPEIVFQTGHNSEIISMDFSPDDKTLISTSGTINEGIIKFWDLKTGKETSTLAAHSGYIYSMVYSPDGKTFASCDGNWKTKVWDASSYKNILTFEDQKQWVNTVAYSPDGRFLACSSTSLGSGVIKVLDLITGKEVFSTKEEVDYKSIEFSSTSDKLIAAGEYKSGSIVESLLRIWDLKTAQKLKEPNIKYYGIKSASFDKEGKRIICRYKTITVVIDAQNGSELFKFNGMGCALNSDHTLLASSTKDSIKIWNLVTGKGGLTFGGNIYKIKCAAFSHGNTILAIGDETGRIAMWNIGSGAKIRTLKGHVNKITSIALHPKTKILALGTEDNMVRIWDISIGKEINQLEGNSVPFLNSKQNNPSSMQSIKSLKFDLNGNILAASMESYPQDQITVWDFPSFHEKYSIKDLKQISLMLFSPDNKNIVGTIYDGVADKSELRFWNINTGKIDKTISDLPASSLIFMPDDKVITNNDIRDLRTGSVIKSFSDFGRISDMSLTSNKKYLAITGARTILFDIENGDLIHDFEESKDWNKVIAIKPDNKIVAVGGFDKTIKLWDAISGQLINTLNGHKDAISAIAFTEDGNMLISASWDAMVKLWNVNTGQEIASLIPVDKNDFIIITPDNYFMASHNANMGIAFKYGDKVYPFEQFDLKYNRPDIVLKRIGFSSPELISSYNRTYLRRLRKMNFTEKMFNEDFHLPEISILSKNIPLSTIEKNLKFKIKASDSKYLLDRINIYINDVPVYGVKGISLKELKKSEIQQEINLELSSGQNKIQVSVLNEKGVESLKETFDINCTAKFPKPNLFIVAIGISKYQDSLYNLEYADKDANDIVSEFGLLKGSEYGDVKTLLLKNEKATLDNILKAKQFLKQSKVNDITILFFAGHGMVDAEKDYFLGTYDIDFLNPSKKGLPYDELANLLDEIPARKKLLLLDACFSGEIEKQEVQVLSTTADIPNSSGSISLKCRSFSNVRGLRPIKGIIEDLQQDIFVDLRRGTGAVIISSSSGDEFSIEGSEWKNGVFTYSILDGLKKKKADKSKDGLIQVSELKNYVIDCVKNITNGRQNPTVRQENLADDFVIY